MYLLPSPGLPFTHLPMIITAIAIPALWFSLHCGLTDIVLVVPLHLSDMFVFMSQGHDFCHEGCTLKMHDRHDFFQR